jgi:hypothetical protein
MDGPKCWYSEILSFAGFDAYLRISDANFLDPFTDPTIRHSFVESFRSQKNPSARHARLVASFVDSLGMIVLQGSVLSVARETAGHTSIKFMQQ